MSVLCTPFDDDGKVHEASLRRLTELQLRNGVDALVVHGLAGEAYKLSDVERDRVLSIVVETAAKSVPVVAGCEHPGTEAAANRARAAVFIGADAVVALPPYFVKASTRELKDYYLRMGESSGAPLIIQDAPTWTGVNFSASELAEIASSSITPIGVKVEAPPTPSRIRKLRGLGIPAIGGYGAIHLPEELTAGICGFMPGCAYSKMYVDLWQAHIENNFDYLFTLYNRILPILVFQMSSLNTFVAVQKQLLYNAGIISSPKLRSPGAALDTNQREWLDILFERTNVGLSESANQPKPTD